MIPEKFFFDGNFEVVLADSPESRRIHYNLRYQVYCDEMGFEDKDKFPDRMEIDEWDHDAVHFLVRHKASGHWLGGLRLVLSNNPTFPFEELSSLDQKIVRTERQFSVEISRLCITREARRFVAKRSTLFDLQDQELSDESGNVKSIFNYNNHSRSIMWGLFRAAVVYSAQQNIKHWYFIVAPALASYIRKQGVDMYQIGAPCHHRGLRIPCRMGVDNILANPLWLNDYKKDFRRYSELMGESTRKRRVFC
ncbi:PEP-CTERM/exosortase system-associated acyltransferase [Methylomonas sp. LL1]|uniref:PEP-CTERM/exosortase system-associated acyltransferase n=1 Tax=Methylomonas sp. LL1 TaxID=2785785 RepID=UPI0018C38548|nr:PEP-CTERM/exosortase system-associated acyltransferase [Methylomonas sp. LL1]QPK61915.1 PEP-CTERM/exosortase system-associated acyltransferase [Methylomonas sp. LL1]